MYFIRYFIIFAILSITLTECKVNKIKTKKKVSKQKSKKNTNKNNQTDEVYYAFVEREDITKTKNYIRRRRDTGEDDIFENDKVDPFAGNLKWSRFVKLVDRTAASAMDLMKNYTSTLTNHWSSSNADFSKNKKQYLQEFSSNFSSAFTPFTKFFKPLHQYLEDNAAHTRINPLIDLQTITSCIDLGKKKSTKMRDMTRLKWIEINAMATTVHHVFDHLSVFLLDGLNEIDDAVQIPYPSWITETAIKTEGDTFENMDVENIVNYIDKGMVEFGEKNHLIRGLERILRKKLTAWDPRITDYNIYCYGNNKFGIILDQFDILTDAALYLSLADIKYSLIQMIKEINSELILTRDSEDDKKSVDFSSKFEAIIKNMTARIDKKIKFAESKDSSVFLSGPILFKCDHAPELNNTKDGPIMSAPNCPPGVYVQNNEIYENGNKIPVPSDVTKKITGKDGKEIECIKLEPVAMDPNGTVLLHDVKKGECTDTNGTKVPNCEVKIVPVVVDETGTPISREPNPTYPVPPTEWGKFMPPDGISPVANGTHPILDPQGGPQKDNDPNLGYLDPRTPKFDATTIAQFAGAFGGYLESELVLSPDGTCAGTCLDYHRATPTCNNKTTHCDLYRKSHCEPGKDCMKQSSCPTKSRRCVRTSPSVSICAAKPDSGRLYDWISINGKETGSCGSNETKDGDNNPNKGKCDGEVMIAKERWEMESGVILNTPQYCELCLCVCDDPLTEQGHHFFDLTPSVADVKNGFVVTAVKFAQTGQNMRLIIEEGKLVNGEEGEIDITTLKWQEASKEKSDSSSIASLGSTGFKKMNLDVVHGIANEVVSGVRFRLEEDRLELDVQFVIIDKAGVKNPPTTEWRAANFPTPIVPRSKVNLDEACSPLFQRGPSQPFNVPSNSEFVEFDATSLEKDAGQSVIPFFDIQSVQYPDSTVRRPLTSVGILYKSKMNSGGFISPSVSIFEAIRPYE